MRYEAGAAGGPKWTFYAYGLAGEKLGSVVCTQGGYGGYDCARESAKMYFGGTLIATMDAAGTYSGVVTDRLGSVRATKTGGTWTQTNYYAWGEEKSPVSADGKTKYATYTRDSTLSGQDYADQRYSSNIMGRFFSPDPSGSADLANPLSLNQYTYVNGDPVNSNDPRGLNVAWVAGPGDGDMGGGFGWDGISTQEVEVTDPDTEILVLVSVVIPPVLPAVPPPPPGEETVIVPSLPSSIVTSVFETENVIAASLIRDTV
jgi:RHS repeat-associated protein